MLAGGVTIACRFGRLGPATRHALWLVVLIKLLTPPVFAWPWQLPDWEQLVSAGSQEPVQAEPLAQVGARPRSDGVPRIGDHAPPQHDQRQVRAMPTGAGSVPARQVPVRIPTESVATAAGLTWASLGTAVFAFWLTGAMARAVWQTYRVLRFRRLIATAGPAPVDLVQQLAVLAAALGVAPPRLQVLPGAGSPLLWCLGRPRLLMPAVLLRQLDTAALACVLVHELAHLRRRDHWVSWLLLVGSPLWWWNPLFWWVRRELRQNAELACDAWVVDALPDGRRSYAATLIEVSRLVSEAPAPVPALAMARGRRAAFERRLTMILRDRVPCKVPVIGLALIALCALAALPCWLPAQPAPPPAPAATTTPGSPPAALPLEEALLKARVQGKYAMLLRQLKVEKDFPAHKAFEDLGLQSRREYAGHTDLPKGYWVYVYPYWYIWRDLAAAPKPSRNWGPEQATGAPDTPEAGDIVTAWASRTPDEQDEWLLLEYANPIVPRAVLVYETYNPGAVVKVSVFRLDGTEVEVWKGKDPTSPDEPKGISAIPIKVDFKTNRVKVYINSRDVPGWNEIDAVGLRDAAGKTHWAAAADASSTYAELQPVNAAALIDQPGLVGDQAMTRIIRLEREVTNLKKANEELRKMVKELQEAMNKGK
jgi:beta-lactamase regulating signal transducer with metallopeptidase domain